MDECLFCQIVEGKIESEEITSTDTVYAFRDIHPGAPTHVLVIPKAHIADASQVDSSHSAVVTELITVAHQIAESEGIAESGYRLVFNVGDDAGNTVPHLHLHLLGGRKLGWPPG